MPRGSARAAAGVARVEPALESVQYDKVAEPTVLLLASPPSGHEELPAGGRMCVPV